MFHQLQNYLRTYRKRSCLSQDELAGLLGCRSGAKVSRYEKFTRLPSLKTIMAYLVLFKTSLPELFAGMYQKIRLQVEKRILALIKRLKKTKPMDKKTTRKIDFLQGVLEKNEHEKGSK